MVDKGKIIVGILGTVMLVLALVLFIRTSNDHIECSTESSRTVNREGIVVTTQKHICREHYSF